MPSFKEIRQAMEIQKKAGDHISFLRSIQGKDYGDDYFPKILADIEEHKKTCPGCSTDAVLRFKRFITPKTDRAKVRADILKRLGKTACDGCHQPIDVNDETGIIVSKKNVYHSRCKANSNALDIEEATQ